MLIAAYVFIGQQSHMSDMPLLHVICTTVKGNRSPSLTEARRRCGRRRRRRYAPGLRRRWCLFTGRGLTPRRCIGEKKCQECKTRLRRIRGLKGPVFYPVRACYLSPGKTVFSQVFTAYCWNDHT